MLNEDMLRQAGLDDFEVTHAMDSLGTDYGAEHVLEIASGRQIRCPAFPAECDYARVTTVVGDTVVEIAYWNVDEFRESAAEVLGALLGAAGGKVEAAPPTTESEMSNVYRTTFEVSVLHEADTEAHLAEQLGMPLSRVLSEIDEGEMLGHTKARRTRRVPKADLKAEQVALGGDGTFFPREGQAQEDEA